MPRKILFFAGEETECHKCQGKIPKDSELACIYRTQPWHLYCLATALAEKLDLQYAKAKAKKRGKK